MSELRATYRLQLTSGFGFSAARELVPYLRDLGISHLYLSPSFQARPGSTHGYDVIDPGRFSEELGGLEGFRSLARSAAGAGMGIVLDVVPNHMCADSANRYWADPVLREQFFDIDHDSGPPFRHRRFFDIDELAGVRIEDPDVFEAMSGFVLGLVKEGLVDGLRVDHPDGLADPLEYLERLRAGGASRVWVEKILDPSERLRPEWPVSGTVGYEFLNDVAALFVDPAGESGLTTLWQRVSGDPRPFAEVASEAKLQQALGPFEPEVERLIRTLGPKFGNGVPTGGTQSPTFNSGTLGLALAALPVYRTYVDPISRGVAEADRAALIDAVKSGMQPQIAAMLLLETPAPPEFVTRFQQTTPAIMAKGVEDTAFYRYLRLLALNDVGGDPSRFGIDVTTFHEANAYRQQHHPENLLTTMTHDAKRSADVRARIGALAQIPQELATQTERFMDLTKHLNGPDDQERYLIFQTLLGAWPIELDRLTRYVEKALREAKRNTNWITPNEDHERAAQQFCAYLYEDSRFEQQFGQFVTQLTTLGRRSALSQLALKLTSPGIPDIYQGDELEYRALVDPDNRRPVDWRGRDALLRRLMGGGHPGGDHDVIKLQVTMRLLGLRARRPRPFAGAYEPLDAGETGCAYVRGDEVLTLALLPRAGAGTEATLKAPPGGRWRDVISGVERSFDAGAALSGSVGEYGFAVYERL
jgi:(1->4)-alpha-D-glucan 1-alpha-D-glucosylmutase